MSDEVSPERIAAMAAAARVPITPAACARVARAVMPTVTRLSAAKITLALETEPSSFTVVQRRELGR
ncbi:MAG TPA: hypothetical protein VK281_13385 [Xanthobacteraceae bacterium]|nr:hypothetical protein [Xanthobacteraceae bacterium]